MLKGHGDDIYNHKHKIVSNFSSNIYNQQDLQPLQTHLCVHINSIHSYPEPDAESLNILLGEKYNVSKDNICVTNGATEAIYLIAQVYNYAESVILSPTFSEYADACIINNHSIDTISSLEDEIPEYAALIWLCNPNNPTGKLIDKTEIISFIESHNEQIIIIDESYEHFTTGNLFSVSEAIQYPNVILIHSMTKNHAIPGLRLGYITANEKLTKQVEAYRMPWSVNQLAIEAGKFLLSDANKNSLQIESYLIETKRLQNELSKINGLKVYSTDTHFFLCRLDNKRASDLKLYLIENFGILIRDASNFGGLGEHYFRIATQSMEENNLLIKAIREWI